jgi:putative peptidoglycan lipid II flippase
VILASRLRNGRWGPALVGDTAQVTAGNATSRATGLLRVLAIGGALGTTYLGNAYQSANLVSNLLFELLAAGILSSVLVPSFVALVEADQRDDAARLAGAVLGVSLAVMGVVTAVGLLARPWIARALTVAVADPAVRAGEIRLVSFLLVFFLPQVLLYSVGAVSTALLHSNRRFAAAAFAPVANNVVVVATMATFWMVSGAGTGLDLSGAERALLAVGTTAGVLAMTAVPLLALRRAGIRLRPRWEPATPRLRAIGRAGAWGAVAIAMAQVLIGATLVLANRVEGGVVAWQIAFAFFLLPFALLAHPVTTTLFPRLAAEAAGRRWESFAASLSDGLGTVVFWTAPASALLVVVGPRALELIRFGALDAAGTTLVGRVVAAYALGVTGYAAFHLLTRASYATGDMRSPGLVAVAVAVGGAALMVVWSAAVDGQARVVVLGLAHSAVMVAGAVALFVVVRRRVGEPVPALASIGRALGAAAVAAGVAYVVDRALPGDGWAGAALSLVVAGGAGAAAYCGVQRLLGAPELMR